MPRSAEVRDKPARALSLLAVAMASAITLSACGSTPMAPTRSLQAAEQAITSAEQARVADHASLELSEARNKLAAARAAVQREEMLKAERLADEAFVSAQLATARASAAEAKAINDSMQQSTETLKEEMNRNTGLPE